MGTINVDAQSIPVSFSGSVTNCSGTVVANGTISILLDGFFTTSNITNGNFSVTVNRCYSTSATAQLTAVDLTTNLIDTLSINNITITNITSLQLKSCTQSDEYINYTVDNSGFSFSFPPDSVSNGYKFSGYNINAWQEISGYHFAFFVSDTVLNSSLNATFSMPRYGDYGGSKVTFTQFSSLGGYVAGSFSGNLADSLNGYVRVPIQGTFKIKRTY